MRLVAALGGIGSGGDGAQLIRCVATWMHNGRLRCGTGYATVGRLRWGSGVKLLRWRLRLVLVFTLGILVLYRWG